MSSKLQDSIENHNSASNSVTWLLRELYGNEPSSTVMKRFANDFRYRFRFNSPPFDPFRYADALGVKVEFADIEADGVFICKSGEERILLRRNSQNVNSSRWKRVNFTLAHELGHFVIREEI